MCASYSGHPLNGSSHPATRTGSVKSCLPDKNFGFITPDDAGDDVFVHRGGLDKVNNLQKGDAVTFELSHDERHRKHQAHRCCRSPDTGVGVSSAAEVQRVGQGHNVTGSSRAPTDADAMATASSEAGVERDSDAHFLLLHDGDADGSAGEDSAEESEFEEGDEEHSSDGAGANDKDDEAEAAEEAATNEQMLEVSPSDVRFTHDRISACFRNGTPLDDTIDAIVEQTMDFDQLPPVICVSHDGLLFSLNNRRVFVARVLQHKGLLQSMKVQAVHFEHPYVQRMRDGRSKWDRAFSTSNKGESVRVRSRYKYLQTANMAQMKRDAKIARRTEVHQHMANMKPVILMMLPRPKGVTGGPQKAKWHLQDNLPCDILDTFGKQYGISWEIYTNPSGDVGIKAFPSHAADSRTPEEYRKGCLALREAVRRRYQFKKASTPDQRATEKQKTLDKNRRREKRQR
mmetsp:Transcript_58088/g.189134  ORF Transcript_58088/g.189134 Transcript_58088/m.189134 type:complete len:458 (-) Transcript_58088:385-1758(-)